MLYLIDGYNLLFAMGLAGKRVEPKTFERARRELLDWIHTAHQTNIGAVTVIFDGAHAPEGSQSVHDDRGLHVQFAVGQLADDLIEELIRSNLRPDQLTVVSSDHRIQKAAKRRGCIAWDSTEYVDWVMDLGHEFPTRPSAPVKPESVSDAEMEIWMKEFGAIDNDPEVEKFNRPFKHFHDGAE